MSATPTRYRRKVRFSDTDCLGHVFNANYFVYFDDAITDHLAAVGQPCDRIAEQGFDLVLVRAECDFRSPGLFGEVLVTEVETERVGNTSVTFRVRVVREGDGSVVAEGREVYVVVGKGGGRPEPVPAFLREALGA